MLALFAQGCGSGSESPADVGPIPAIPGDPVEDGGGEVGSPRGEACYAGARGEGVCFPVVALGANPDYQYSDPFTDPSFPAGFNREQYRKPVRVIDLSRADAREKLAPHFQLAELMNVDRGRFGLFSPAALRLIEEMRVAVGRPFNVNSAYRSPARNGSVGGVKWSRHVYGDAIDFYSNGASLTQLRDACVRKGASFYQLYETHIHCDWRGRALDPAFYGSNVSGVEATLADIVGAFNEHQGPATQVEAVPVGSDFVLRASRPFQEDEGQLTMEWKVKTPSGDHFESNSRAVTLPRENGDYTVDVVIGGSLEIKGRVVHVE